MPDYHIPVLLSESVEALDIRPEGTYVDVTFGAGGHTRSILNKLNAKGRLFAFDMDTDAQANVPNDSRFTLIKSNYRYISKMLRIYGVTEVDGILADLGISSHQIDEGSRGFSFRFDAELDMRMNQFLPIDAKHVLNTYSETELLRILSEYGEVRNARTLAKAIAVQRKLRPLTSTFQFNALLDSVLMGPHSKYYAQVYQAIRIEVNQELKSLEDLLVDGIALLAPAGRFSVITYHSLEDRLVKNIFKSGNIDGKMNTDMYGRVQIGIEQLTRKPILADSNEQRANSRSRSAKLRVAVKK